MELWFKINMTMLIVTVWCLLVAKFFDYDEVGYFGALAVVSFVLATLISNTVYILFAIWGGRL